MKFKLRDIPALVLILFMSSLIFSCSTDEGEDNQPSSDTNLKIYRNLTGTDALQAHYKSADNSYSVNFYGLFDVEGNPTDITTVSYQKANNDTIVNMVINPDTHRIVSTYNTVNGVNLSTVHRYDYNDADNIITISVHDYDWMTNTSETLFSFNVESADNSNGRLNMVQGTSDFAWNIAALGTGIAVAEVVAALTGSYSGLGALAGLAAPVVAAVAASSVVQLAAIGAVVYAVTAILNNANASELDPEDYPTGVSTNNPATDGVPVNYLNPSPCAGTKISFRASMDGEGRIMVTEVSGGQGPYQYLVDNLIQGSQVFTNEYAEGPHVIAVQDSNGCISAKLVTLTKDILTYKWYAGTYTLHDPDTSDPGPLDGQSFEIYFVEYKYFYNQQDNIFDRAMIAYVKSVIPGVPSFYYKSTMVYDQNIATVHWVSPNAGAPDARSFNIYVDVEEGVVLKIKDTEMYPAVSSRVHEYFGMNPMYYNIDLLAFFTLESPPAGLTDENMVIINEMIQSDEGFITVEE